MLKGRQSQEKFLLDDRLLLILGLTSADPFLLVKLAFGTTLTDSYSIHDYHYIKLLDILKRNLPLLFTLLLKNGILY